MSHPHLAPPRVHRDTAPKYDAFTTEREYYGRLKQPISFAVMMLVIAPIASVGVGGLFLLFWAWVQLQ